KIHALVQHAYDIDLVRNNPKKEHMRARRKTPIAPTYLVARPPSTRIVDHDLDGSANLRDVAVGLFNTPSVRRIVPNFIHVRLRSGRKDIALHLGCARSCRFRSMNSSKSNGVEAPLCSPSIRAARRASSFASCSSSRRKPAVTTSLAESYRPCATCR